MNGIFKSSNAENLLAGKNIQSMTLLAAAITPPSNNKISNVPMVEENALVPNVGPSGTVSESLVNKPTSDQISTYVVREGDTLSQIAEMFDVTVNTIKWGN